MGIDSNPVKDNKNMGQRHTDDSWRLTIDREVKDLSNEMAGMKSGMDSMNKTMLNLVDAFDHAQTRQQDSQKTPWANYLAAAGVVLVVFGMVVSGYVRDLERQEARIDKIESDRVSKFDTTQNRAIDYLEASVATLSGYREKALDLERATAREVSVLTAELSAIKAVSQMKQSTE